MKYRISLLRNILCILCVININFLFSQESTGRFYIDSNRIINPEGVEFIANGVNIQGMKWVWPGDPVDHLDMITASWKFNLVRVNCKIYDGYWNGENVSQNAAYQTIEEMQTMVDAFTDKKVVVMFDMHDKTGSFYRGSELTDLGNAWREMCDRFKENPYVWFNIMNEPGGSDNENDEWINMHREIIEIIRDEKQADNVIVIDGQHWGQDVGDWNSGLVKENNSAILKSGKELKFFNGKEYENVVFSFHVYDQWNGGSAGLTQKQANLKMSDFIQRAHEKGLALIIGEYGTNASSGDLYYPEAFKAVQEVAIARRVGRVWWHWYGGDVLELTTDGNGGGWYMNDPDEPTNLTWPGKMVWDDNHFQGNRPPYVSILTPSEGKIFEAPAEVMVTADIADADGQINTVKFFWKDALLHETSQEPYTYNWFIDTAGSYMLEIKVLDDAGATSSSGIVNFKVAKTSQTKKILEKKYTILQNYPNPFHTQTVIPVNVQEESTIQLSVYNIYGKKIKDISRVFNSPGNYDIYLIQHVNIQLVPGIYLYSIKGEKTEYRKMIVQ